MILSAASPSSYFLGRLFRTMEKYITAKAASNTPPNIKIKVVTIFSFAGRPQPSLTLRSLQAVRRLIGAKGRLIHIHGLRAGAVSSRNPISDAVNAKR